MNTKKCPRCRKIKPISKFGYRVSRSGKPITQSYCHTCRSLPKKVKKVKKVIKK